jgi:glutamate/tyrosine decarboxylase-like PLP-dependent enzyme
MQANKSDWDNISQYLKIFETITEDFFKQLDSSKVAKMDVNLPDSTLSEDGVDLLSCIEVLKTDVIPQLSAARGSRYWGFVTGGATPVATLADWLVATFDQNVHKGGDSIATEIERQSIKWLCDLFELPYSFKGIMTTGATACNFLAANCARQFAGLKQGIDTAKDGVYNLDIEILSATPHASMIKSLGMSGLGQRHVTKVNAQSNSEAMDVEHLRHLLENSKAKAQVVIASAGTVTATDFDDLDSISALCKKHDAWLHVDAAFGLFERLVNGPDSHTKSIEKADSITVDCHKWLNVPYDSGVFLTRHLDILEQCFDVPAPYLLNESGKADFMSLGVENSRRFRALPVWLSLLAYGKSGVRQWVERNIKLAQQLANWIDLSDDYELVHPCNMNVALFRPSCTGLTTQEADKKTVECLKAINKDGRLYLSPGLWQGREIIRIALSNWQTEDTDIDIAIAVFEHLAK